MNVLNSKEALLVALNEGRIMKILLMFLSVAILSGCGGGLVTHMNKDSVSIQWDGLTSDLESVTKQAQEKCAVFGRKAVCSLLMMVFTLLVGVWQTLNAWYRESRILEKLSVITERRIKGSFVSGFR